MSVQRIAFLAGVFLAVALLSSSMGCTRSADASGQAAQANDVARQFIEACNTRDRVRFFALLTEPAREALEKDSSFDLAQAAFEDYEIGTATLGGCSAIVPVNVKGSAPEEIKVLMRREKDTWRVYGMRMEVGPGAEMTIEFANLGSMMEGIVDGLAESFEEGMRASMEAEKASRRANFEGLCAVDDASFESQWKNATDYQGSVAADALRELATLLGLVVDFGKHEKSFADSVTLDLKGRSRIECIEAVANGCGFFAVFPSVNELLMAGRGDSASATVRFEKGTRPNPIAFEGPFMVRVSHLEERVPHGVGTMDLTVSCFGVEPAILALLHSVSETVQIETLVDAKGRSLRPRDDVHYLGGGISQGPCYENTTRLELRNLLRDVATIQRVSGRHGLALPRDVVSVNFDTLRPGVAQTVGDLRVTVQEVSTNTSFDIEGPEESLEGLMASAIATDAAGKDVAVHFVSLNSWGSKKSQLGINSDAPPSAVRIKFVRKHELIDYPFELLNIALPNHEKMPETIEPLTFGTRDCPIDLGFRSLANDDGQFPDVEFRGKNHANKDAMNVLAQLFYLGPKGEELGDFTATLTGSFEGASLGPVVRQGSEADLTTTGFFMPKGVTSVRAEVHRVQFVDGTVWER